MRNKKIRFWLSITLLIIVIAAFAYYLSGHYYLITRLRDVSLPTILLLIALYILWFGAIVLIMSSSLAICKKTLGLKENVLLNGYSTLVNFFIPGQAGIAVRGVYLKKLKNLPIRNYIFISLIYYMFFAVISAFLLLVISRPWWQTVLAVLAVSAISFGVIYIYRSKSKIHPSKLNITFNSLFYLFVATLIQSIIQISIYAVELRAVNPDIAFRQVITYTGAANFALFVALTPGAIGIRESFLVLTHKLNGISNANIISANIIDRAVFFVFLGLLFLLTLSFHAKYKNLLKQTEQPPEVVKDGPQ